MDGTDDIKARAKKVLDSAPTEEVAVEKLEELGLDCPCVSFSEPNEFGYMMKMGMAFSGQKTIYF